MPDQLDKLQQMMQAGNGAVAAQGDWTLNTLREYFCRMIADVERRIDERITSQKDAVLVAMNSADRAVTKAEAASEKRFESVNEFRAALSDTSRLQMPRLESEALFKALSEKVDAAVKIVNERIDANSAALVETRSTRIGMQSGWGYAVGVVGVLIALGSMGMTIALAYFKSK